ncbi:MAG: TatD family hydrolase [Rhodospirillales bacterium]
MLIDSHCHLDFPDFGDDFDEVLKRAREAGVGAMVTISTEIAKFPAVQAIAERHDNIFCSVGVHPHEAENDPGTTLDQLLGYASHPKVVGIGETGLDFYYEHSPREVQASLFRTHIAAARETGLPVIVHTRDADPETIDILRDEHAKGPFPGVIHCFTAGPELAQVALDAGLYISISGIVTFKKADEIRETVKSVVPMDRLLVETDSPYLAPVPKRGKRNEPAFTRHTADFLADMLGVAPDELEARTTENFKQLFAKAGAQLDAAA